MTDRLVDVASIAGPFAALADPRHTRNRKHDLLDVLVICVAAIVSGADGPTAIARWAHHRAEWLATFLSLANGVPSRDCIRRLLIAIDPAAFQRCFQAWIALALAESEDNRLVAIDGKTCRGSRSPSKGLAALHCVSAWSSEHGIALGQVAVDDKSNEITAIPEVLKLVDLPHSLVTIDAIGCQKEIVEQIASGEGSFVIAVKENQPKLHAAIVSHFETLIEKDFAGVTHRCHETLDKGHGRIETRSYHLVPVPEDFEPAADWPRVKAIGYAINLVQHADGRETSDERYFILDRMLPAKRFAAAVRGHWGIESMHWVLDVTFREDEHRTRHRVLANHLSWLKRFAIGLLKRHPLKDSIRGKMQRCAYDEDFLAEVLGLP